jgi:biopolymer transport protein ExbB/TolQ
MDKRFFSLFVSLAITVLIALILIFSYSSLSDNETKSSSIRILILMGGNMPLGIIQMFTYFLFIFSIMEIAAIVKRINVEEKALVMKMLPEKENWIISPTDVASLKLDILSKQKHNKSILSQLIISVCTKYRSNKSTSESMELLSAQVKLNRENDESQQSMIRYIVWAIPSVGFIGTVIGIANSLGAVKQNMSGEDLTAVTSALNVAFDTTLVALVLSLFLMYFYHYMQERVDKFHSKVEFYVLENLINRIYHT